MHKFTKLFLFSLIFLNQIVFSETKNSIARKQLNAAGIEEKLISLTGLGVGFLAGCLGSSIILEKFASIDYYPEEHVSIATFFGMVGAITGTFLDKLYKDNDLVQARRIFIANDFSGYQNIEPQKIIDSFNKFYSNKRFPLVSSFYNFQAYKDNLIRSKNLFIKVLNKSKDQKIVSECKFKIAKVDLMLISINKALSCLFENAEYKSQVEMQNLDQNKQNTALLRNIQLNQIIYSSWRYRGF